MTVNFNSNTDWDAWYFAILRWMGDNWIMLSLSFVAIMVAILIFKSWISPLLTEYYKELLGYEPLLTDMKLLLENDYEELWEDADFCVAFLKFYEDYQTIVSVARSDHAGKIIETSKYNSFVRVRLGGS